MPPRRPEPFDAPPICRLLRQRLERIDHILLAHLSQPVNQAPGVIEHDSRRFPLPHQFRMNSPMRL